MSNYAVIIIFVAVSILFVDEVSALLRCRICHGAKYLDSCHTITTCSSDEYCYMDFKSMDGLNYQYWGGCRSRHICESSTINIREPVVCSKCCARDDCNTGLCGLSYFNNNTHCLSCPQGLDDVRNCNNVVTCADDEMCYSSMRTRENAVQHFTQCFRKEVCKALTMADLESMKHQEGLMGIVGRKRETIICDICCGGDLCNNKPCTYIRDLLYLYYKHGRLNNETLTLQVHHP